jgi:hypothetical protein
MEKAFFHKLRERTHDEATEGLRAEEKIAILRRHLVEKGAYLKAVR